MSMEVTTRNLSAPEWTQARITLLGLRWSEGASAAQIAGELGGVTRSAVIGKIHRCGFKAPDKPNRIPNPLGRRLAHLSRAEKAQRQHENALMRKTPQPLPEPQPNPGFLNITFDQLQSGDCRYPTNSAPPFVYCGQPAIESGPYCLQCYHVTHKRAA